MAVGTSSVPRRLTGRELEVLRLLVRGGSNRAMAAALGITPKTVGHHIQHIYDKIGVSSRAAATLFAVEHRLLHVGAQAPIEDARRSNEHLRRTPVGGWAG
jgi:DNA-binding NarL/FixJ family response regulator